MRLLRMRGNSMQRINGHRFYDLALRVHPLLEIKAESPLKDSFWTLWEAREALLQLFAQMPLRVCSSPAQKLVNGIDTLLPRDWAEAIKKLPGDELVGYPAFVIVDGAREFETVLDAELQSLDTYLVSQKGTHSTPDLIERAEIMFPERVRQRLPGPAIADIRQAGRCLALDNYTASAFHILRAVESVMAVYFELVIGKPMPTRMRNWGIYLKKLGDHPDHSPRVITFIDHIRENYRNPILHPDVVMAEDEAEALLGASASAIRMLVLEIQALENKAKSLPLELEPPSAVA